MDACRRRFNAPHLVVFHHVGNRIHEVAVVVHKLCSLANQYLQHRAGQGLAGGLVPREGVGGVIDGQEQRRASWEVVACSSVLDLEIFKPTHSWGAGQGKKSRAS